MIQAASAGTPLYRRRRGIQVASAGSSNAFAAAVLALSPLLYYKLDDPSGLTATDSSGNARNGTYGSGVTLNQASLLTHGAGKSASFDGTANANAASTFNPYTGDLTIGGWANATNFAAEQDIFGSSVVGTGPVLGLVATTGQPFWRSDSSVASVGWLAGDFPVASNVFWCLTWANTTKTSELFINAVSKGTKVSLNSFNVTPGNFQLGRHGVNAGFLGKMDDSFIVSGVLSGAQITTLFNAA